MHKEESISVLIVEDDFSHAIELEMLLKTMDCRIAGTVESVGEALGVLSRDKVDLILLDIMLKGNRNGVELGQLLHGKDTRILYITSLDNEQQYRAAQATNSVGYIVKPTNKFTLRTTVQLALDKILQDREAAAAASRDQEETLLVHNNRKTTRLRHADILLFESSGGYTIVRTKDGKYQLSDMNLGELEVLLADTSFVRVHRGFIINVDAVNTFDLSNNIAVVAGRKIPVSRRKKAALKEMLERLQER